MPIKESEFLLISAINNAVQTKVPETRGNRRETAVYNTMPEPGVARLIMPLRSGDIEKASPSLVWETLYPLVHYFTKAKKPLLPDLELDAILKNGFAQLMTQEFKTWNEFHNSLDSEVHTKIEQAFVKVIREAGQSYMLSVIAKHVVTAFPQLSERLHENPQVMDEYQWHLLFYQLDPDKKIFYDHKPPVDQKISSKDGDEDTYTYRPLNEGRAIADEEKRQKEIVKQMSMREKERNQDWQLRHHLWDFFASLDPEARRQAYEIAMIIAEEACKKINADQVQEIISFVNNPQPEPTRS